MNSGYFIAILTMAASWLISWRLKSKFKQYSQVRLSNQWSGAEIAQKMLAQNGIYDVKVISTEGELTDHYNPTNKTVNLSHEVYSGRNVSAAAVAAHECGHAVQHAQLYGALQFRSSLVPVLNITSSYMQWIILIGFMVINISKIPLIIGVGLFSITTLFSFITLPVEFDASRRALKWIDEHGIVNKDEHAQAKDALFWAALTYVVAALGSLGTLLYYINLLTGRRSND